MATQADIDRLQSAFLAADEAGNTEDAAAFAAELRRLTSASASSSADRSTPTAPIDQDTYLSRSVDGIRRGLGLPDKAADLPAFAADNFATGAKAIVGGVPFIGAYADNLYAKANSAVTGRDEKEALREYRAPVDKMNPYIRTLLAGGGNAAATLAVPWLRAAAKTHAAVQPLVAALESVFSGPGRRNSNKPLVSDLAANAINDAIVGATGSVAGMTAAAGLNSGINAVTQAGRAALGRPPNPYIGRGGERARKALEESVDISMDRGAPPPRTDIPLLAQPAGASAAREVQGFAGRPAARLSGAAADTMSDTRATEAAGSLYQDLGLAKMTSATEPADLAVGALVPFKDVGPFKQLAESPYVAKAIKRLRADIRWDGIPANNVNFLDAIKKDLAAQLRGVSGKKGKETVAGSIRHVHDKWAEAMDGVIPGYADVAARYARVAQDQSGRAASAKLAGGASKYTRVEADGVNDAYRVGESASATPIGMAFRGGTNLISALVDRALRSGDRAAMTRLSGILTEKDPAKIAAAIRALRQDVGSRRLRPSLVFQGQNAADLWREQEN